MAARLAPPRRLGHHSSVDARSSGSLWLGRAGFALGLLLTGGLIFALVEPRADVARPRAALPRPSAESRESAPELDPDHAQRRLLLPRGGTPRISCGEAQHATLFLARELAAPAIAPTPAELAGSWSALMDPHGMWSASPDSPLLAELERSAPAMLKSLHQRIGSCAAADDVGRAFQAWSSELGQIYDAAFEAARKRPPQRSTELFELVAEPIFEDDPVTRPGRELARELGQRLGAFAARFPDEAPLLDQARARFFPSDAEELAQIATLAALRAYVPLVDPHGDFAPLDEEWALYAGDSTLDAGSPLWGAVARVPLGARITSDPAPPLELDDLLLAIDDFSLAGASIDQIEQAARADDEQTAVRLRVLRQGEIVSLSLAAFQPLEPAGAPLQLERIPYGRGGVVLRIVVPDVHDELGRDLEDVLTRAVPVRGAVLLDLRGNGGGSLDAAVESLGLFLPGAPLFSLIHRGRVTEILRAPRPARPYSGAVAALIDGDTASAAEMLAGALQAYGRAPLIGVRSFGKGCVQEYFDDVAPSGVLRMTTLQFVMPDGRPLQQIGLSPDLGLPLAPAFERESQITRQPITFEGPDVRDASVGVGPVWPGDSAAAGPCEDPLVCLAIARLAKRGSERPTARDRAPAGRESGGRATRPRAGTR
jgi:carboxyl-terminal processing protease